MSHETIYRSLFIQARCVLAGHFDEDGETRMSFHQGCDVTVAGAAEQISLPMTRDGTIFNLCRPLADGDGIDDLTAGLSLRSSVHGATDKIAWTAAVESALFSALRRRCFSAFVNRVFKGLIALRREGYPERKVASADISSAEANTLNPYDL